MADKRPIGVFDSGMGGLTVLRALMELLPSERFIYLGDTARLPYGTKSPETVEAYALQATRLLIEAGVKMVVVACNTASAVALASLARQLAPLPVIGVIDPGARAGVAATRNAHIAVIATEGTVKGGAYKRAVQALRRDITVTQQACQVFVALAEEGWIDSAVTFAAAETYLKPLFNRPSPPDTLVLGCTHFPVLADAIAHAAGSGVTIVNSAATTASSVAEALAAGALANEAAAIAPRVRLFATDSPERFARVGRIFLGRVIDPKDVELVDLRSIA